MLSIQLTLDPKTLDLPSSLTPCLLRFIACQQGSMPESAALRTQPFGNLAQRCSDLHSAPIGPQASGTTVHTCHVQRVSNFRSCQPLLFYPDDYERVGVSEFARNRPSTLEGDGGISAFFLETIVTMDSGKFRPRRCERRPSGGTVPNRTRRPAAAGFVSG